MFKKTFGEKTGRKIDEIVRTYCQKNNANYKKMSYEILGNLHYDFENTMADLLENETLGDWVGTVFEPLKVNREIAIEKFQFKPVAIKGLDFCRKCKGDEFVYWQAQTRGNDEQTTTFRRCVKCSM